MLDRQTSGQQGRSTSGSGLVRSSQASQSARSRTTTCRLWIGASLPGSVVRIVNASPAPWGIGRQKPAKAEPVLALLLEFPLRFRGLRAGELEEVRRRDKAAPFREPAPLGTEIDHRCALGPRRREAQAQLNQLHPMLPGAEKRARALSAKCRREVRDWAPLSGRRSGPGSG